MRFAVGPMAAAYTRSVDIADDEVCLGQLQAPRLGEERAEATDQKWTYWQHVW